MSDTYVLGAEDRAKFSALVARVWGDQDLEARYASEPTAVLAEHGVVIPEGSKAPEIPARPEGDLTIEELEDVSAGLRPATFFTAACPVSSFGTISD